VFSQKNLFCAASYSKSSFIINSTGPAMLTRLYESYEPKTDVCLLTSSAVTPLSKTDVINIHKGNITPEIEQKVENAYAIHYFFNSWLKRI